jgi:hypothetical protein
MSRIPKTAAGLIVLVGLLLLGLRLSTAGDISSEQLLLKLSDLPAGSRTQVRGPLVPGSQANGFINRDGTDIVKEYMDGERVDFMVPLAKIEGAPTERSTSEAYISHLVYRFSSERAAANEFQRLVAMIKSWPGAITSQTSDSSSKQSIVFVGGDSEIPGATHRWFFMQRGKFLLALYSPGPMQNSALQAAQSYGYPLTQTNLDNINRAIEVLFAANVSRLQSR